MHAEFQAQIGQVASQYPMPGGNGPMGGGVGGPILPGKPPTHSEFATVDAEGMPGPGGTRHHGAVDWFAKAGTPVQLADRRRDRRGQAVEGHLGPGVRRRRQGAGPQRPRLGVPPRRPARHQDGPEDQAGQAVAGVTDWQSGSDHTHIELWKTLQGGYNFGNALDPLKFI